MDNPVTPVVDTPVTPAVTPTETPVTPAPAFSWKAQLPADFVGAPTMQKFPDTKEGFEGLVKSHLSLEKLLGYEKVPIPKGKDDPARAIFNKAMGIPDKPEGYGLADIEVPESLKGLTFDKAKFQEAVHKHDLTPMAAKGLWEAYTGMAKQAYADALKSRQEALTGAINELKGQWGDAYQSKVELGQMVINRFSDDKEMADLMTAVLTQDPRGIKFLAKIGEQFAENKISGFQNQRHALTPAEAQAELDGIRANLSHPYNNEKSPAGERDRAIDYVNSLLAVIQKAKGQA